MATYMNARPLITGPTKRRDLCGVPAVLYRDTQAHVAPLCESVDSSEHLYTLSHMPPIARARLLALAERRATFTAEEARAAGIHSQEITRLLAEGLIERVARGQYQLADRPITEHHSLVVAAKAVPHGVICLLSALSFHEIGTQLPADVWVAIEHGTRTPSLRDFSLKVARYSGAAFTEGVELHKIEGESVRIYSVAKTLADLFKFRNKIGLDIAMEALREAWRDRKFSMDGLDRAARACRVERVIRPYVEAVVS
jgi:predicted transcriptional regulator of viral defense system